MQTNYTTATREGNSFASLTRNILFIVINKIRLLSIGKYSPLSPGIVITNMCFSQCRKRRRAGIESAIISELLTAYSNSPIQIASSHLVGMFNCVYL